MGWTVFSYMVASSMVYKGRDDKNQISRVNFGGWCGLKIVCFAKP